MNPGSDENQEPGRLSPGENLVGASCLGPEVIAEILAGGPDVGQEAPPADAAAVLFLLHREFGAAEPSLLLTKRSARVRQPGDLCYPGGSRHRMDAILGLLLRLPGSPLRRSPGWASARRGGARKAGLISRYWACALREAWEETGLRPPGIRFLGCLPMYRLVLFRRAILPLVGWVEGPRRFRLNWEVERLVPIPLSDFLDPRRYARYRLDTGGVTGNELAQPHCYPCFRPRQDGQEDVLWGATYHIAISFLERAFAFRPPPEASRPVISGTLAPDYATGSGR